MRKAKFSFVLMCIWLMHFTANSQHKISTILENGSPEELYNIVVVAEAFTEEKMPEFERLAREIPEILRLNPTYEKLLDKINIYAIHTPSVDNEITLKALHPSANDPIQETTQRDTYFGIYFQNSYRAYFLDVETSMKARKVAASHIPFTDNVVIMVNAEKNEYASGRASSRYGVSTFGIKDNFGNNWEKYLLIHELAHALGGLSDGYASNDDEGFNKSSNHDLETIRWKNLLEEEGVGIDKAREEYNVYIPNQQCVMTWGQYDYFCPVCSARIEEVVTTSKNERIPEIRRVDIDKIDPKEYVYNFEWEAVEGATQYEIIFTNIHYDKNNNYKREKHFFITEEPNFTLDLDNISTSSRDVLTVRAFNETFSTNFSNRSVTLSPYEDDREAEAPKVNVSEIGETSVKLQWDILKPKSLLAIRLRNEKGNLSEFTLQGEGITLNNLTKGGLYTLQIAHFRDGRELYDMSEFSEPITLQLKKVETSPTVAIYPNPASEYIQLSNDNLLDTVKIFEIFDTQGNLIRGNRRFRHGRKIHIRNLRKGRYILKLDNGMSFQFDKN